MSNSQNKSPLLPVYLVVGEDILKRDAVLKRLETRLSSYGDLSFNSDRFNGEVATGSEIVNSANTLPFASEIRYVRVDDVEKLHKADSDLLVDYLKAPCDSTLLLLIATKLAKNTRLRKAVEAHGSKAVIDCSNPTRRNMSGQVAKMAAVHGISITPGAVNALIDLVGINTVAIDSELSKLSLSHRGTDPINENEVLALVSRTSEVKPWEFVDAFASRNMDRSIQLLTKMAGSSSPYSLLAMCVNRVRELITTKALIARGQKSLIAKELKLPDWRVRNHATWARAYSMDELVQALAFARDAEQEMKSGGNPDTVFLDWFTRVIRR